jgi:putative glycosyltransferase (TIGR04348 family)
VHRSSLVIVSPALKAANNGNWQTARRWRELLGATHRVRITDRWPDAALPTDDVMLALHAARSADAIAAWAGRHGSAGLGVVLTGTDLYGGLDRDPAVLHSLERASRLVVLQDQALAALPALLRNKARTIYQSTPARQPLPKTAHQLRIAVVGHLREVKSPQTVFALARQLGARPDVRIDHAGGADAGWAAQARQAEADSACYRWLGPLSHGAARRLIQRAHLLLHPSAAEGGAHVVMEAVRSGTPVLASRIPGNVGMLGPDYEGYFAQADAAGLAELVLRCRREQQPGQDPDTGLLARLRAQCGRRAGLFDPDTERAALLQLVQELQDTR